MIPNVLENEDAIRTVIAVVANRPQIRETPNDGGPRFAGVTSQRWVEIDAVGDKRESEERVFDAVEQALGGGGRHHQKAGQRQRE